MLVKFFLITKVFFILTLSIGFISWSPPPKPTPPKVCFTLYAGDCPNALGGLLKIKRKEVDVFVTQSGWRIEYLKDAETKQGYVSERNVRYVKGKRKKCFWDGTGGDEVKCSWRDLFYHHHGRYPTEAELNSMTEQQASDWFRDKFKNTCWPSGPQYPDVESTNVYYKEGGVPICFDFPDKLVGSYNQFNSDVLPFECEIVFPNGQVCKIKFEPYPARKPGSGTTTNIQLRIQKPCPNC